MEKRENFGGRLAVILTMAGSAIGLGNIWRFPYIAGEQGGGAFIIIYILASFILALPIFFSETIIGRRSGSNAVGAMKKMAPGTKWKWVGIMTVISPIIVLSYYSVVGGWSVEYLFKSLAFDFTGVPADKINGFFGRFISSTWEPVLAHTIFIGMTAGIILGGVRKGIEKFSKVTMPILFLLIVVIAVYSICLPGARAGVDYLIKPDFSKVSIGTVAAAMGQAFFSLSLGVGTILTYGSYVRKQENLFVSGAGTAIADILFAILAGFAIMPAVFAAGIQPGAGPGLVFETLPFIFNKMGTNIPWISAIVAILFFLTILVAALTSAVSMFEVGVAYLTEEKGCSRKKATLWVGLCCWAIGLLCSLSFGPLSNVHLLGKSIFDFLDGLCSNWLMPLGGLMFTLFVGWKMSRGDVEDEFTNRRKVNRKGFPAVYFLIRYVAPVGIVIIFLTNLLM